MKKVTAALLVALLLTGCYSPGPDGSAPVSEITESISENKIQVLYFLQLFKMLIMCLIVFLPPVKISERFKIRNVSGQYTE